MLSRLHAGWLLAWSLVKTLTIRLLRPGSAGLAQFQKNYLEDRLLPLSTEERLLLPDVSGCIACGRCDAGQGNHIANAHGAYRGIMAFVLSASRSIPDFDAAAAVAESIPDEQLDAAQDRCPADIPFGNLVRFVRSKAQRMPSM